MLSIKFLGGVMVAAGIIWWGMCEARRLKLRVDILKGIMSGLMQ